MEDAPLSSYFQRLHMSSGPVSAVASREVEMQDLAPARRPRHGQKEQKLRNPERLANTKQRLRARHTSMAQVLGAKDKALAVAKARETAACEALEKAVREAAEEATAREAYEAAQLAELARLKEMVELAAVMEETKRAEEWLELESKAVMRLVSEIPTAAVEAPTAAVEAPVNASGFVEGFKNSTDPFNFSGVPAPAIYVFGGALTPPAPTTVPTPAAAVPAPAAAVPAPAAVVPAPAAVVPAPAAVVPASVAVVPAPVAVVPAPVRRNPDGTLRMPTNAFGIRKNPRQRKRWFKELPEEEKELLKQANDRKTALSKELKKEREKARERRRQLEKAK